jgi:hypothetical protein
MAEAIVRARNNLNGGEFDLRVIPAQAGISHVRMALYVAERFLPAQE